ncbi:MAG: RnfABCDGE type electron transport complex subunit G [Oligoflexia bacterium]|nr:RnfABCDGE type electron transport complex subunit G [Oligoflexia bacterium]
MNLKKTDKTSVMFVILIVISAVSAGLVSMVYGLTKPVIENQKQQRIIDAVKVVLPDCDNIEKKAEGVDSYFVGTKNGVAAGCAFTTVSSEGYGGDIKILMGVDINCRITGFRIMEHLETPGLGTKADSDEFKDQFKGRGLDNFNFLVEKDGGDVDAITAATISSRAVTSALKKGIEKFSGLCACK